ncbi:hypothetical protein LQ757_02485 [Agromyces sp. SYSU K20354]|uniref:hypothetical protein n=1 Tax=Agromyces cavernae TaxID=2898659 RepID=UPI001E31C4C1|nr:hypothetical protein [Agromyces cavernae]MCD2441135.1 hypothetical protein [Agromyces cavernae]
MPRPFRIQNRTEMLDGIVDEFLHNSPRGRRLIAVDGADDARAAGFADDLAERLEAAGQHVLRVSVGDVDEATLRTTTVEPFRAGTLPGEEPDTVLIIDGRGLLTVSARGMWHFSLWTLAGDELPHAGASVIVDVTDDDAPTRYFYDYCALPPSVGDRTVAARTS